MSGHYTHPDPAVRDLIAAAEGRGAVRALHAAGAKIAQYRNGVTGRRVANAELFGQMVYAMGDEITYQQERCARDRIEAAR